MNLDAQHRQMIQARAYESARYVRSMLGSPWDRIEFAENLEQLLERAFNNYLTSKAASAQPHLANGKWDRAAELIEFDLPLLWLHPVCGCENRSAVLATTLKRLSHDFQQRHSEDDGSRCDEFFEWVHAAIEATESAQASLCQTDALQKVLTSIYRQWCKDHACQQLSETEVGRLRHWVDGLVESIADVQDRRA